MSSKQKQLTFQFDPDLIEVTLGTASSFSGIYWTFTIEDGAEYQYVCHFDTHSKQLSFPELYFQRNHIQDFLGCPYGSQFPIERNYRYSTSYQPEIAYRLLGGGDQKILESHVGSFKIKTSLEPGGDVHIDLERAVAPYYPSVWLFSFSREKKIMLPTITDYEIVQYGLCCDGQGFIRMNRN